jgi:hypothetical protein
MDAAALLPWLSVSMWACGGGYFPDCYLCLGDAPMLWAPTANFANEIARMKLPKMSFVFKESETSCPEQTAEMDVEELRTALLKSGSTNRPEIIDLYQTARQTILRYQQEVQRAKGFYFRVLPPEAQEKITPLDSVEIPKGLPDEFSHYLAATIDWHSDEVEMARTRWGYILNLPKEKRTYRTICATFMLGKSWLDEEPEKAIKYFQKVRELAANGWRDSLGLAASSYGWEACAELNRTNYAAAINRYIDSLGAGDRTATQSLQWTVSLIIRKQPEALIKIAQNKVAQRVVTAHLISRFVDWSTSEQFENPEDFKNEEWRRLHSRAKSDRSPADIWLEALEGAEVKDVELAEQLALASYQAGEMEKAQRWIRRAPAKSLVAQWLQAKLFLRNGQNARAANLLAKLAPCFPLEKTDGPPPTLSQNLRIEDVTGYWGREIGQQVAAELAILQITRREYSEALDLFLRNGFDRDAAYVAERVLTLEELKGYVDRNFPDLVPEPADTKKPGEESWVWEDHHRAESLHAQSVLVRELLGRRLMRAFHFEEAIPYLSEQVRPELQQFVSYWDTGYDTEQPNPERAWAFFAAANLMQTRGDKLFGSETEPFWRLWGNFDHFEDSALTRMTNAQIKLVSASADEIRRVTSHAPEKRRRFNYHYWAADLAWNAAQLMPNNSDETARVLHAGGTWIKYLDQYEADRFYKALVRRCRKTQLGDAADKKRWFPLLDEFGKIVYPLRDTPAEVNDAPEATDDESTVATEAMIE